MLDIRRRMGMELEKCPFCGGNAVISKACWDDEKLNGAVMKSPKFAIECTVCSAGMDGVYLSEWNRRVSPTPDE